VETASTNPPYFFKSSYLSLLLDPSIRNRNKKYDEGDYRFFHIQMYYSKIYQKRLHNKFILSIVSTIHFALHFSNV
jgi:cyanate lyase